MDKKKIAVLGLGDIARKAYLPILAAHPRIELMLYNRSAGSLREIQELYRVKEATTSLEQVLESRPEAAFVLTATPSHYELIKTLLKGGVDVFVEKPATLYSWQTQELAELADERGRILMVCFNRRYAPLHVQAKKLWGDVPVSLGIFQKFRANASHPDLADQLISDIIHQIDLLRYYCGEGHAVSTVQEALPGNFLGAVCTVRLDSGGMGVVMTSLQAGRWSENYALYGGKQSLEIDAFDELRWSRGSEQRVWKETYASSWQTTLAGRGFAAQIEHFLTCLDTRQRPLTSAWDSVKTQLLTEEIIRLGEEGFKA